MTAGNGSGTAPAAWIASLLGDGWRMAAMSLISLVLGYVLTIVLHRVAGLQVDLSYGLAIFTCSTVNFFGCRYWVFHGPPAPLLAEAGKFFSSIILFRVLEIIAFSRITDWLDNYHAGYFLTACIAVCLKFLAFRLFVFRRRRDD